MFNIKFNQNESQFLHHDRYKDIAPQILKTLHFLKNHFILFSSGTTSAQPKGYAVSEKALFANAQAVNTFFKLTKDDVWGLSLPHFHIGGLSVIARSHLLGSKLVDLNGKWDPSLWTKKLDEEGVTITTVVPTQIFDIVKNKIPSPQSLRYIIVGGDFLSSRLAQEAIKLGWPVIKTFGMTEVCSQLASASSVDHPELVILPIHKIRVDQDQRLWVKSQAMYTLEFKFEDNQTTYLESRMLLDEEGYFPTNDVVELKQNHLVHLGRKDDQIKIKGRLTSVNALKDQLYNYALDHNLYGHLELNIIEDPRSGKNLEILHTGRIDQSEVASLFVPIIPTFRQVLGFDKTDLGKIKKNN